MLAGASSRRCCRCTNCTARASTSGCTITTPNTRSRASRAECRIAGSITGSSSSHCATRRATELPKEGHHGIHGKHGKKTEGQERVKKRGKRQHHSIEVGEDRTEGLPASVPLFCLSLLSWFLLCLFSVYSVVTLFSLACNAQDIVPIRALRTSFRC